MKVHLYCLLLLLHISLSAFPKSNDEMPIAAFWGIPDTMSYERCFKDFSDCGFNVSIYPYWQLDTLVKACNIADKY